MKFSILLGHLGRTGGLLAMYKHAENLTRLGHEVHMVLQDSHFQWKIGDYDRITKSVLNSAIPTALRTTPVSKIKNYGKKVVRPIISRLINSFSPVRNMNYFGDLESVTHNLIQNWVKCDVTIATFWTTSYAAAFLSRYSLAFYYMQHYEELTEQQHNIIRRIKCRNTYGLPLHLIANSDWLANQIKSRFGRNPFRIQHAIFSPELFKTSEALVEDKFSNKNHIKLISYCDPRFFKGWKYAVEGMKIVQNQFPNIEWRTFGTKIEEQGVKIQHLGQISYEDLATTYQTSHIGIFTSLYESFPVQPLEMMTCGCAVVTTPFGTEDYTRDGENCLIIKPKNPQDLANKVMYLINNLNRAKTLALNGLKNANKLTWDASTNRLLEIIEEAKSLDNKFADVDSLMSDL